MTTTRRITSSTPTIVQIHMYPIIPPMPGMTHLTSLVLQLVTGLDQNIVLVNDPARRKLLKLRRSDFETAWKATDNWTLLALPQEVH